jgi:hypothetical protein
MVWSTSALRKHNFRRLFDSQESVFQKSSAEAHAPVATVDSQAAQQDHSDRLVCQPLGDV